MFERLMVHVLTQKNTQKHTKKPNWIIGFSLDFGTRENWTQGYTLSVNLINNTDFSLFSIFGSSNGQKCG